MMAEQDCTLFSYLTIVSAINDFNQLRVKLLHYAVEGEASVFAHTTMIALFPSEKTQLVAKQH